jgi:hypothetical protein
MPYLVRVYDNFHYMDEDEAYELPPFATAEEALARCEAIVDRSLRELREGEVAADALYQQYQMFGDDPIIIATGGAPDVSFSGWRYAKARRRCLPTVVSRTAVRLIH